ncbi:MAG: hypothetical protein PVI26_10995 [Chitinispirillia bacterium]
MLFTRGDEQVSGYIVYTVTAAITLAVLVIILFLHLKSIPLALLGIFSIIIGLSKLGSRPHFHPFPFPSTDFK